MTRQRKPAPRPHNRSALSAGMSAWVPMTPQERAALLAWAATSPALAAAPTRPLDSTAKRA